MYIPDWSFERQMRAYDRALSVRWMPRLERWGIYRRTPTPRNLQDRDVLVMVVEGPRREYMPLDHRTLDRLRANDLQTHGRRVLDDLMRRQEEAQMQKERDTRREFEDMSRDIEPAIRRDLAENYSDVGTVNVPREDMAASGVTV